MIKSKIASNQTSLFNESHLKFNNAVNEIKKVCKLKFTYNNQCLSWAEDELSKLERNELPGLSTNNYQSTFCKVTYTYNY